MRQRVLKGLRKDLAKLSQAVRSGCIHRQEVIFWTEWQEARQPKRPSRH
jgi:hypothetical protein